MWSAFMNGSGLQGGGGAGGGYVQSQGWEFVPCSRMDGADRGGRGKNRSPSRRISSPPTVFSHIYDSQFSAPPGGGDGGAGTQLEILRGQMWPGAEHHHQQQTQHTRLKKKFEDLKKRHVQDKEEWMREKESLLREVADIQGGENRRILLELKTVLEDVQVEVKKEEEKRSELQLQYTRDRCAWDLEKAELKCRIAQLEAREGAGLISSGVQSAAGCGSVASRCAREQHGETSTLRREREEQRRLLVDTHSTAMDLRCRLEHNERDWLREKAELLERFDVERREWECQLKDMQRKIEQLYCDVGTKRVGQGSGRQDDHDDAHRLSIHSTSTGSSLLSDNDPLSSSSQSEPLRHPLLPGFGRNRDISGSDYVGRDGHHSSCFQADSLCGYDDDDVGQFTQNDHTTPELVNDFSSRGTWQQDSATDGKEAVDTIELDAMFHGALQNNVSNSNETNVHVHPEERPLCAELSYGSEKKKNTTALNAALKEIARVSEELCSYQDEIRKKSGDKRNQSETLCLTEESEMLFGHDKTRLEVDEAPCDLNQIYDDLRALERENWITLSPENTWRAVRGQSKSWIANTADPESNRETKTSPGLLSEIDPEGPPVPPRTSSWNLSSPTYSDTELHIPESPVMTVRKCHSPCVVVDKKCSSPSIVRKFEAMLQENEGKVLVDGVVAACVVPANSECINKGCCHNRWSCDASKFTSSKLSTYGTVQKSFSEVNILTAGKHCPGVGNLKKPELQIPQIVKELPLDLLLSSLEIPPAGPNLQGSKRNIMLEQKTAEFNRTLFQAEMGRDVEKQDSLTVTDACSVGFQPVFLPTCASDEISPPRETTSQPLCTDVTTSVMDVHPGITLSFSTSNSKMQNPELQSRRMRCGAEGQEGKMKQGIPSDLSSEQPQIGLTETTTKASQSPAHHCEVKHKVQTASGPFRKAQHRAATEPVLPANTQPGQGVDGSSSKNENSHGAKPQSARVGVSLRQPSAENQQRQMTQPVHQEQLRHASVLPSQPDSSRPGPRIMNDHPWKALTLAAYPRPEGSRSNYGAVEKILRNYESAARAHQNQSQPNEMASSPDASVRQEENVTKLDMTDVDPLPLPPTLRHTQTSYSSQKHTTHAQFSSHSAMGLKELHLTVQENDVTAVSSSVQKNFSRPARPANQRLPSRWASRSPISSPTSSSSPSTTPAVPPSYSVKKLSSSLNYSHAFRIETVII
ncbi:protein SOGA3a [Anoplopoma fimbria]|uniref:protein SOGA3a n=1 Tax=Anoplopoma fimbria TaxID=229290 RepID=UPI0023EB9E8E|nr:protein SOGA3a [Anoplopoma fimbria]